MWTGRLILLALLALDWGADGPVPGDPFSPPLSSTEAYPVSRSHREAIAKELALAAGPASVPPRPEVAPAPGDWPPPPVPTPRHDCGDILRLHMTLLC
jgi:hypothetical protein